MWIPGDYLAKDNMLVHASIVLRFPAAAIHIDECNVVAFQVIDSQQEKTARGDRTGHIPCVVRPLLNWTTDYSASSV